MRTRVFKNLFSAPFTEPTPGVDDGPEYSPDGRYLYFNSTRSGAMQIWPELISLVQAMRLAATST